MKRQTIAACAIAALALGGAVPALATTGHTKPAICHPVGSATGGNQHNGYSLIHPANPSSHIDESLYPDGHYWKHEHDGRHDFYADGESCGSTQTPPTVTQTVTVTVPTTVHETTTLPGTTSTVTVTEPGSTTTVTQPGATQTVTQPGSTSTVTLPGSTVTQGGPTVTAGGPTVTKGVATTITNQGSNETVTQQVARPQAQVPTNIEAGLAGDEAKTEQATGLGAWVKVGVLIGGLFLAILGMLYLLRSSGKREG